MIKSIAVFFDRLLQKYTPDPFVIALFITAVIYVAGVLFTPTKPLEMAQYWGNDFWKLSTFTLQMVMILITGYVVASSPYINRLLISLSHKLKTQTQAVLFTTLFSIICCWINWGFGLVCSAFLCRRIATVLPHINFRLLIAAAYSGFLVWHGGLSGSIPLLLATPGNFSEKLVGGVIGVEETLLSPLNMAATFGVGFILLFINYVLSRSDEKDAIHFKEDSPQEMPTTPETPAEKWEASIILPLFTGLLAGAYLFTRSQQGTFKLDLNMINFIFLMVGFVLHGNARRFIASIDAAARRVGPILLQFPFYAGIMGMMRDSGLADQISNVFVAIASPETFNVFTFLSAGIVNLFVPSGGGQWAVQAPIVLQAVHELGVSPAKAAMAVAWGDAWTNMLQPFWALPILAIAGLKLRHIMSYCVMYLLGAGLVLTTVFYLF